MSETKRGPGYDAIDWLLRAIPRSGVTRAASAVLADMLSVSTSMVYRASRPGGRISYEVLAQLPQAMFATCEALKAAGVLTREDIGHCQQASASIRERLTEIAMDRAEREAHRVEYNRAWERANRPPGVHLRQLP